MDELQESLESLIQLMEEKRIAPEMRQKIFSLLATQVELINAQLAGPVAMPPSAVSPTQPQSTQTTVQSICPRCSKPITLSIRP